jgi:formylglycine-generating enzyme required for sulfatase activity
MVAILLSSPGSYRREYVEALDFLANLSSRMENVSDAIKYCESELALLDELGSTEAARVRNQIEALRGELETFCEFETVLLDDIGRVNLRRNRSARRLTEGLGSPFASEMVAIPGGTFTMGSPTEEEGSSEEERPQHEVTISPFSIGKFPVTQAQWRAVARWEKVERELNADPSHFKGDDRPVEQVSWEEATEFCLRVSKKTGKTYRLPTEAEWEYACRAGTKTPFAFGKTITPKFVNYDGNHPYAKAPKGRYRKETVPVGSLGVANAWGLYDMHGNVWEWCQDWSGPYMR